MSYATELGAPAVAPSHALPDPGERVPAMSWPILAIFLGAVALFAFSTWGR